MPMTVSVQAKSRLIQLCNGTDDVTRWKRSHGTMEEDDAADLKKFPM